MKNSFFYGKSISQIEAEFQVSSSQGLSASEVQKRVQTYGGNSLTAERESVSTFKIFFSQLQNPLFFLLLLAGGVSLFLQEWSDAIIIFFTAFMNAVIGFFQEYKAGRALEKLRNMVTYSAVVLRDGEKKVIPSEQIVPGDILFLEAGASVQADGRIIQCVEFEVNESALTGESEPVKKNSSTITKEVPLAERLNMVFRGTAVVSGRAHIVVTATGSQTEIGHIASLVSSTKESLTPLQLQLKKLSKVISIIILIISLGIFLLGVLQPVQHHSTLELFKTAVALAVAAIPEGLIISLTVILAIGMQRILSRNALVRKMVAAETLGSVSVICTDKTGTLTEGVMKAVRVITYSHDIEGKNLSLLQNSPELTYRDEQFLLKIGALCNNARFEKTDHFPEGKFFGNMTDIALAQLALENGFVKNNLEEVFTRINEVPFSSKRKYMATLHILDGESFVCAKGAPDVLLEQVSHFEENGKQKHVTKESKKYFEEKIAECTKQGFRLIAVAYKKVPSTVTVIGESDIQKLTLLGFVALSDPLRPDVKETFALAHNAGIRIVMITGDHARTAQYIGAALGLPAAEKNILIGSELEAMSAKELEQKIGTISIFARVDPKHKIRIVEALQKRGEVVAMTGDGINDSPALKGADIGIAVGSGTDVAKDIADLVLLDNNFGTIVSAVEEGRKIYQNIKKVLLYLFSFSLAEVFIVSGSLLAGFPLAVLPAQILWINLVQDSLPAIALAFEKMDKKVMSEKPRKKNESIFDSTMKIIILSMTIISNILLFTIFLLYLRTGAPIELVRTMIFGGLGVGSFFFIYSVRSLYEPIWTVRPFQNMYLNLSVLFGFVLLLCAMYVPLLQTLLNTVPLRSIDWLVLANFGILNLIFVEMVKFFISLKRQKV